MSCEACRASVRPESVPVLARVVIVPRLVVACTPLAIPVTVCVVPPPPIGRGGGGRGGAPSRAPPGHGPPRRRGTLPAGPGGGGGGKSGACDLGPLVVGG